MPCSLGSRKAVACNPVRTYGIAAARVGLRKRRWTARRHRMLSPETARRIRAEEGRKAKQRQAPDAEVCVLARRKMHPGEPDPRKPRWTGVPRRGPRNARHVQRWPRSRHASTRPACVPNTGGNLQHLPRRDAASIVRRSALANFPAGHANTTPPRPTSSSGGTLRTRGRHAAHRT